MKRRVGHVQSQEEAEKKKHQQSMEELCRFLNMPLEQIAKAYLQELDVMKRTARIKDYLPILVSRKVKNFLRHL